MQMADIAVIGLAVMGENLALNMESKGFHVAVFNRSVQRTEAFLAGRGKGKHFIGCRTLQEVVAHLQRPRRVFLMIRAGQAVDDMIDALIPLLEKEDIVIDGGNSLFTDTIRRAARLEACDLRYIGTGISGGEEGALHGPSIMPGGSMQAWPHVKPIFQKICAHLDDGFACCDWIGGDGAGHFVKMVHNGIEYADIQLICEAYQLLRDGLQMDADELAQTFAQWNETGLKSYLMEITADIMRHRDEDGQPLLDRILDTAGQKGTGKWTAIEALNQGVPVPLIGEAVFSRCLSAHREERETAAAQYRRQVNPAAIPDRDGLIEKIRQALYASKIVAYAQGFALMRAASESYGWELDLGQIALIWRGGCIIRSVFLDKIKDAYSREPQLQNLLLDPFFRSEIGDLTDAWSEVVSFAALSGIPVPAFSSALNYFYGYTETRLPANLLQAQRDYFGAHTYERVDQPRGTYFHTHWTGAGDSTSASTYNA